MTEKQLAALERARNAAAAARRIKTHCKRNHPLSGDNLYVTSQGKRQCKTCHADSSARYRAVTSVQLRSNPDDPRHGTPVGYRLCGCMRCRYAESRRRHKKRNG